MGFKQTTTFSVGDRVVYRKRKQSTKPTLRAREVHPAPGGDTYTYSVDKFWIVSAILDDGRIEVITRRGKVHHLTPDDECLRKSSFLEKLRYRSRFPSLDDHPNRTGTSDSP